MQFKFLSCKYFSKLSAFFVYCLCFMNAQKLDFLYEISESAKFMISSKGMLYASLYEISIIKKEKPPFSLSVRFPAASVDAFQFAHARFYAAGRITSMFKCLTSACGGCSGALQVML